MSTGGCRPRSLSGPNLEERGGSVRGVSSSTLRYMEKKRYACYSYEQDGDLMVSVMLEINMSKLVYGTSFFPSYIYACVCYITQNYLFERTAD